MQMARRRPPQSGCRGSGMGGERPQSCLGTGTAHQGARGVSPQRGAPRGASRLGSKTARSWKTSTRVAVISQHPSCPWPLRGLRFPAYFVSSTSPQLSLRFFSSFAELGFRWPVVSLVSGVFPVWGRPDGQIEVRAFRKYLRRSIPEIVARLYCPKSLLEPPLDRVLGRQRLGALEKPEENFRRVPGSGSFAGLDWGAGVA